MKIDLKNKRILYELDKNARFSHSFIAKSVLLSKDAVNYRIKNLEDKGILKGYRTIVNLSKLGYILFRVYLKLIDMTQEQTQELIQFLEKEENAWWIARLDGSWDFAFAFWGKENLDFYDFYFEFSKKFRRFIKEKMISPIIMYSEFPRRYLTNSNDIFSASLTRRQEQESIDDIDRKILSTLSENARTPLLELSKELGVDSKTISNRIKKLEEKKIILGYKADIDVSKIGRDFYTVEIDLNDFSRFQALENEILSLKEFTARSFSIEGYDLEFDLEVESSQNFYDIIKQLRTKFKEIREIRYFRVLENHKLNYVPSTLF